MQASDGGTALHCAAEFGHESIVALLLDSRPTAADGGDGASGHALDVTLCKSCVEAERITALHLATTAGAADVVRRLIEAGCDVNAQASDGFAPIHLAAQNGMTAAARVLLDAGSLLTLKAHIDGCSNLSPLHLAVRVGNEELVDMLLDAGVDVNEKARISEVSDVTMLHLASVVGHAAIMRKLIALGCDVNAKTSTGSTPIYLAVKEGNTDAAQALIDAGCDVNRRPSSLHVGLMHLAIIGNRDPIVRMLARAGCSVDEATESEENGTITPLYLAVDNGRADIVKTLISLGADVDRALKDGFTVVHTAAEQGRGDIVALLADAGACVDKKARFDDLTGVTPLHLAVMNRHRDVVMRLARVGADLNLCHAIDDRTGYSAVYLAVKTEDLPMTKLLLSLGCRVDQARDDGWTPLHAASERGLVDIVRALLDARCDVNVTARFDDSADVRPLHLAAQHGHALVGTVHYCFSIICCQPATIN